MLRRWWNFLKYIYTGIDEIRPRRSPSIPLGGDLLLWQRSSVLPRHLQWSAPRWQTYQFSPPPPPPPPLPSSSFIIIIIIIIIIVVVVVVVVTTNTTSTLSGGGRFDFDVVSVFGQPSDFAFRRVWFSWVLCGVFIRASLSILSRFSVVLTQSWDHWHLTLAFSL